MEGRFVRRVYTSAIQRDPRRGDGLLAFNSVTKSFESAWSDDFRMSYTIMLSQGTRIEREFSGRGDYDAGENQPKWGRRTE